MGVTDEFIWRRIDLAADAAVQMRIGPHLGRDIPKRMPSDAWVERRAAAGLPVSRSQGAYQPATASGDRAWKRDPMERTDISVSGPGAPVNAPHSEGERR
ncbi:MAG: hypothetical protein AAF914_09645 [Pseudomonadota bacterium]